MKRILWIISGCLLLTSAHAAKQPAFLSSEEWSLSAAQLSPQPKQVVVIQAQHGVSATIALWQNINGEWELAHNPWPAVIGKNGMALPGQKKEGDGKTPSGLFPISFAFGETERLATGLPYRATSDKDIWVDDPQSPLYNQWSELPTAARSFERMKRKDQLYKLGLIVDYNRHPIIPGAGSAIFIHVWRNESKGTAGCAALAEDNLRELVQALKLENNPAALFIP